jgi:septal ring factor EnvC (AmiA/AmiB activator)
VSLRRYGAIALAVLGLLGQCVPLLAQPSEDEAKARLDALGADIRALSERLDTTREKRDDASQRLESVEKALGETHRRLDRLQAERRTLDDQVEVLESKREALRQERRAQRQALAAQVRALYRMGSSPQLMLLLNQDEPARIDRLQTYLNRLSRARDERIEAIARLDEGLADNQDALTQRRKRLEDLAGELDTQRAALVKRSRERQAVLAKLDARYSNEQQRMQALEENRSQAEQVLDQVRQRLQRLEQPPPSTAIAKTQGNLPWPVQGQLLSRFGQGEGVNRNGLVIAAAEGTRVQAIHPGRVVFADWMRGFGNLLILDHGDDVMSLYAHVQTIAVNVGERVERGAAIATVGNTGGRSRPALYFEVRRGGEPIDPRRWIARR